MRFWNLNIRDHRGNVLATTQIDPTRPTSETDALAREIAAQHPAAYDYRMSILGCYVLSPVVLADGPIEGTCLPAA